MKYIEIQTDYDYLSYYTVDEIFDLHGVKFYGARPATPEKILEDIKAYCGLCGEEKNTEELFYNSVMKAGLEQEIIKGFIKHYNYYEEMTDETTLKELIDAGFYHELIDVARLIEEKTEIVEEFAHANGFSFDTVSYSDFSYYLACDASKSYIQALYEGRGYYNIVLYDETGETDAVHGHFYENLSEDDIIEMVGCDFGLEKDDFKIVDNDAIKYINFKELKKVEKIKHISYSFKKIEK